MSREQCRPIELEQVEVLAVPGDIVMSISTLGRSNNVFHALMAANAIGCKSIGMLGRDGGNIGGIVDLNVAVPVRETPHIQEAHVAIIHILSDRVEKTLFPPLETGR